MIHPNKHLTGWQGILQSDVYGGYNDLYLSDRNPGPVRSALCWSHAPSHRLRANDCRATGRKFFELADIAGNVRDGKPAHDISPIALEAVKRIDAIFDIEREISGMDVETRLAIRQERSRPLVEVLRSWLIGERGKLSKHNGVAKAID